MSQKITGWGIFLWFLFLIVFLFFLEINSEIKEVVNTSLDFWVPIIISGGIVLILLINLAKYVSSDGLWRGCFLWFIHFIFVGLVASLLLIPISPKWEIFRGIGIFFISSVGVYLATRQNGGKRGIFSAWWHWFLFYFGWFFGNARWVGVLYLTVPALIVYYNTIYHFAKYMTPLKKG